MIRTIALGAALAFSLATASNAAILPAPVGTPSDLLIKVAEGCGPGFWRGPHGHCRPFAVNRACPPGYHLGPEGKKCWPNRRVNDREPKRRHGRATPGRAACGLYCRAQPAGGVRCIV